MNITIGIYSFHHNRVIIKVPFEIIRETGKCYFTKECRYLKSEIGKPILKSTTTYPYIELVMVDADEETLRSGLSEWFSDKATEICGGFERKEIKYIIELLEVDNYRTREAIRKIKDRPWQYVDDVDDLYSRIEFVNGILGKLKNI